jgi:hypothetical protein
MISDFLQDYVTKYIWCAPFQDNQAILKLSRLSFPPGTSKHADIWWDDITLPDKTSKWTLYNIGQNTAWRTNLSQQKMKWLPLAYWGQLNKTIFDLYFNTGKKVPTYQAYVLLTDDQDYVLAVRMDQTKYDLMNQDLYMRSYRNGFWKSDRSDLYPFSVEYGGGRAMTRQLINDYIRDIAYLRRFAGIVNVYLNGVWVDNITTTSVKIGDYVEYVHDGSVARIVDFKVTSLRDYLSVLDGVQKYLLHPPKEATGVIRYRDDVDVFLYKKAADGSLQGRYYHRNVERSLRMVTHADYSVPVETVVAYTQNAIDPWAQREDLYLRLHIRDSGYDRPLVDEHTHLKELYKLPDVEIARALLGIDATLDEWYAPTLEQSYYTAVMRKWWPPFDYQKLLSMLGYDAIAKLLSDSPIDVVNDDGVLSIPMGPGQQSDATVFEYNEEGAFLGWYYHSTGDRYIVRNADCAFGEVYLGEGSKILDWVASNDDYTLLSGRMYRFYFCEKSKDVPTYVYKPAVEGTNYQIVDGVVKWIHRGTGYEGLIWSDKKFLINDVSWHSQSGVYKLQITHSSQLATPMPLPTENLMLIINGKSAVEGADYYVKWPWIMVVSKELLDFVNPNKFTIVGMGTPKDATRSQPTDVGFVFKGILSVDDRFDLRDERVMRFVVGGHVKRRKDVYFAEDYPNDNKPLSKNGDIYQSSPVYVPIRDLTYQEMDTLRDEQKDFNKRLEDFLTIRYPQPKIDGPNPILARHQVYSPMLTQMLYDIQEGDLIVPVVPENMDDLQRKVTPYLDYLDYEPSLVGVNPSYVIIVPHPFDEMVEVDQLTYRFLTMVVKTYLKSSIQLNTHFMIKG